MAAKSSRMCRPPTSMSWKSASRPAPGCRPCPKRACARSRAGVQQDYVTAVLGARLNLWGLQSHIGISSTTLQKHASGATLFASFSGSFQYKRHARHWAWPCLYSRPWTMGVVWRLRQSDRRAPSDVLVVDRYGISDQRR